jgi:hypothetical protein
MAENVREFDQTCKINDISCKVLERRALENYFTDRTVKKVKGPKYSALGEFNLLSNANPSWGKEENWKFALEMTQAELLATDLGRYLSKI